MGSTNYEGAKKAVFKGMYLLAAVTLVEVFFSLAGKGYVPGLGFFEEYKWGVFVIGLMKENLGKQDETLSKNETM